MSGSRQSSTYAEDVRRAVSQTAQARLHYRSAEPAGRTAKSFKKVRPTASQLHSEGPEGATLLGRTKAFNLSEVTTLSNSRAGMGRTKFGGLRMAAT